MKEKGGVDIVEGGYICGTPVGGRGIPDPLGPNNLNRNMIILYKFTIDQISAFLWSNVEKQAGTILSIYEFIKI